MSSRAERFRGPIFESSLEPEPLSQKRYFNRGRGASALPANDSFSFTADSRGGAIFNDPMASGGVGERSTSTASDARRWWQFQSQVQSNTDASRPSAQAASAASAKEGRPIFSASDRAQFASPHYPHVDDAATATACDATRSSSSFCYSDVVRASRAVPLSKFAEAALVAGSGVGAAESTWTRPTGKQLPSDFTAYARPGADAAGLVSSHFESRYERPGTTFASASHLPGAATRTGPAVTPGDVTSDIVLSPPSAHALAASNVKMAGQRAFLDEFLRQFHSRRRTAAISASGLPSFEDRRFSPDQPVALGERHTATHATHHSPPRPLVRWNWARPGVYEDGGGTSSAAYSGVGFAFLPLPEDASPRSAAARADPLGDLFIQAARCLDETPGIAGATASPEYDDGAPYALPSSLLSAGLGDTATAAASTTAFVTWCDQQIAAGRGGPGGRRDEWESLPTLWPWIVRSIRVAAAIAAAAAAARSGAGGSRTQRAGASSPLADVRVPATVEHHTAASTKVGSEAVRELLEKTDFLRGRKPEKLLSVAFGAAAAAGHVSDAGRAERRHENERHAPVSDAPHPVMQQQEFQSQSKQRARPNWSQARSDDDPSTAGRSDKSMAPAVPLLPYQRASGAPPAVPTPPRAAAEARPMVPLPPTAGAVTAAVTIASSGPRAPNAGLSRAATPVQPATRSYAPSTQASGRRGQRSRSVSFTAEEFPSGEQGEGAAAADGVQVTGISPLEAAALYDGVPVVAEGGGSAASDPTAPNYRDFYRENVVDVRSHGPHVTPPSVPPVPATAAASSRFAASSPPAVPTAPPAPGPPSAKPPVPLLSLLLGGGSGGGSSGPTANLGGSSVHLPGADGADAARVAAAEPSPSYGGTISLDTSPVFVSASRGAPASPGAAGAVSRGPPSTAIVGADSVGTSATVPPLAPGTVVAARPPPPARGGRPGSSSGTPLVAAAVAVDDSVTAGAPSRRTPSGGRVERRPKVPALPDHTGGPVGFGLTSATVPAMPSPRQPAVTMVTVDVGTPVDADQAREVQIELVVPAVRDDYPTEGTLNQMNARGRERRQKLQLDRMRREDAEARGWQQQQRLPPSGAPPVVPSLAAIAKRPTGPPAPPLPPGNAAQRSAPVRDPQDALPIGGSGWM